MGQSVDTQGKPGHHRDSRPGQGFTNNIGLGSGGGRRPPGSYHPNQGPFRVRQNTPVKYKGRRIKQLPEQGRILGGYKGHTIYPPDPHGPDIPFSLLPEFFHMGGNPGECPAAYFLKIPL
jgi:hypothetical protein